MGAVTKEILYVDKIIGINGLPVKTQEVSKETGEPVWKEGPEDQKDEDRKPELVNLDITGAYKRLCFSLPDTLKTRQDDIYISRVMNHVIDFEISKDKNKKFLLGEADYDLIYI